MMAAEKVCGLAKLRASDSEDLDKFVSLDDRNNLTVGRSVHSDLKLVTKNCVISRNHAVLRKRPDDEWVVTDNKSLNGVTVNGERLVPFKEHVLNDCDIVQFGVKTDENTPAEFVYRFHKKYLNLTNHARRDSSGSTDANSNIKKRKHSNPGEENSPDKKAKTESACTSPSKLLREKLAAQELLAKARIEEGERKLLEIQKKAEQDRLSQEASLEEERQAAKERLAEAEKKVADMQRLADLELEAQNRLKEQEKRLADLEEVREREKCAQERVLLAEQQLAEMQQKLQEKEVAEAKARREIVEKEEKLKEELQLSRARLEEEKLQLEEDMKRKLEEELKKKEDQMKERLTREKDELMEARRKIERDLQNEMERKLEEKDKNLHEELLQQKQKLDKVIQKKELEQKMLECQLSETKAENLKEKENALRVKDDVLSNFADLMETELQCSICNELFIQATSLNCTHSFCSFCIEQWMKKKKECPLCRIKITSHISSIVLDSYIDTMLEHLSEDLKQHREEEINFRKSQTQPKKSLRKKTAKGRRGHWYRGCPDY
ncbi:E3 ubiquitin-protein ligase RNF8-like isoform X2 [Lineus longissimus]|uniref:E3 ubiquitin-protein ligase RNF8-like isoform X2 n=1 Tax=Lineus longissimus TaxID=88925 RepID=UPI00315DC76A